MAPEFGKVLFDPMPVDVVVDAAVDGIEAGRFMITPAPNSIEMFQAKAADYDGFLSQMQERLAAMRDQ